MPDRSENSKATLLEKIQGLETWVTAFFRDCNSRGLSAFSA